MRSPNYDNARHKGTLFLSPRITIKHDGDKLFDKSLWFITTSILKHYLPHTLPARHTRD